MSTDLCVFFVLFFLPDITAIVYFPSSKEFGGSWETSLVPTPPLTQRFVLSGKLVLKLGLGWGRWVVRTCCSINWFPV